jgi:hypothetical protein
MLVKRIRTRDCDFGRHYLQTLAQPIEIGSAEIRIAGFKKKLL